MLWTMSFLVEDDTLEAALAFLDGYDDVDVDDELGADLDLTSASSCGSPSRAPASGSPCSSSNGSTSQSSRSPERAGRHSGAVATTRAKPKRSNAPAAMRLRRKRKAERLHLRDQVAELEALLRRLRQERGSSRTEPALAVSRPREASLAGPIEESEFVRWADVATQIQREREQAEMENIQLRDILAKQVKLARNLEGLLQKRGVFQVGNAGSGGSGECERQPTNAFVVVNVLYVVLIVGNRPGVPAPTPDANAQPFCRLQCRVDARRHGEEDPKAVLGHRLGVFVHGRGRRDQPFHHEAAP